MSGYAVRNDGLGWRSVDRPEDISSDEWFTNSAPPDPVAPPLTSEGAIAERDRLLSLAALRIAPLQDAVDLDDASAGEVAMLKKWKQYRIALNRIDQQAGYPSEIDWPKEPA